MLVVEAFVVDAFDVAKFEVVPQSVVMFATTAVRELMNEVANDAIEPVMLVTVVEARVVDPAVSAVM